jgi:putative ABC transport system permease protein
LDSLLENIKQAFAAIRMNLLRAVLTIFIIAFGIMSLISMLTAVDGMKSALYSSFASVGSNTFTISYLDALSGMQRHGRRMRDPVPITYNQATSFQQRYTFPSQVSLSFQASESSVIQYRSVKTAPKINVIGADQFHVPSSGLQLAEGRNFTSQEIQSGRKVAIIGSSLHEDLFGAQEGMGKTISIDNKKYMVIGSLQPKGSSFGPSQDNRVIIPLLAAQNDFSFEDLSYDIAVQVKNVEKLEEGINDATGLLRIIRKLKIQDDNNFYVSKSDTLADTLSQNIVMLQIIAFAIGIVTLIGAAVGLTNIMLVSVTERTREIGLRKAIGATPKNIRRQFILESLVICQTGGALGILAGLLLGNFVASYFSGAFIIPWNWIIFGVVLCIVVGLIAGLYPAAKAARLDPVESLRHE